LELVVEILQHEQDWGRAEYFRAARSQGRLVHVLPLGDARKPEQAEVQGEAFWLDLQEYASLANIQMRHLYPQFLYHFAKSSGLVDITLFNDKVSLYWLMPISEMGVMRNPLIDHFYALVLLSLVMKGESYDIVTLVTDDPLFEEPVRQTAERGGAHFNRMCLVPSHQTKYRTHVQLMMKWCAGILRDIAFWLLVRINKIGSLHDVSLSKSNVLGLTIFPTLWEQADDSGHLKNRALGDWPDQLKQHGHTLLYIASPSIGFFKFLGDLRVWRSRTSANNVIFIHSLVTFSELLSIYWRWGWGQKIAKWFQARIEEKILFNDVDVSGLVRREFLQEIWHPAIIQCSMIVHAASRLVSSLDHVVCTMHAFEFQPIEKAFNLGVKLFNPNIPVIGLQTSLIGASHMGYRFLPEQIKLSPELEPPYAPLPDHIAAYGTVPYDILKKILVDDRVMLSGPIRYPYLRVDSTDDRVAAETEWKRRLGLNPETALVLLALPSLRDEALTILKWALNVGKRFPNIFLLVRFHYWVVLTDTLEASAREIGFDRYQIASAGLHELLLASRIVITGTSSVGVEAMVSGCMPVIYRTTGRYTLGPIPDIADGAFLYTSENELHLAVQECLGQDQDYIRRKSQWHTMLDRLCYGLDGKASSRFYDWLNSRGVF